MSQKQMPATIRRWLFGFNQFLLGVLGIQLLGLLTKLGFINLWWTVGSLLILAIFTLLSNRWSIYLLIGSMAILGVILGCL